MTTIRRLTALAALAWLAGAAPAAPAAAEGGPEAGKAYLAEVAPAIDGATVRVRLRVRGDAAHSVAVRAEGVQVSLEGAFLDPPKQHIPVDHPAVREIFAYQYDPDTVRVRLLTRGVAPGTLRDRVSLRDEGPNLVLVVSGLPGAPDRPAVTAPVPQAVEEGAAKAATGSTAGAAPVPVMSPAPPAVAAPSEAAPEAAAPKSDAPHPAASEASAGRTASPEAATRAADARAEAMATLERLLNPAADGEAPERVADAVPDPAAPHAASGTGASSPARTGPPAARAGATPGGGGAPAESAPPGPPTDAAAPAPQALRPLPGAPRSAPPDLWSSGVRMAGGLFLVLALLAGGVALLRRVKSVGLPGRTPIRVVASASLGSRQNIVVVEVEGRRLVVGVTPGGMELLADLGAPAVTAEGEAPGGGGSAPRTVANSPFGRALAQMEEAETAETLRRATQDLRRRVESLRARSA